MKISYGILIILIMFAFSFYIVYKEISFDNNECLKQKAIDYCNSIGKVYYAISWSAWSNELSCKKNERIEEAERYIFTKEELKECGWIK